MARFSGSSHWFKGSEAHVGGSSLPSQCVGHELHNTGHALRSSNLVLSTSPASSTISHSWLSQPLHARGSARPWHVPSVVAVVVVDVQLSHSSGQWSLIATWVTGFTQKALPRLSHNGS